MVKVAPSSPLTTRSFPTEYVLDEDINKHSLPKQGGHRPDYYQNLSWVFGSHSCVQGGCRFSIIDWPLRVEIKRR